MKSLTEKLNALTTKADELFGDYEGGLAVYGDVYGDDLSFVDNTKDFLDETITFLESMGGQVESVIYKRKAIWLGYDIPLAQDCIHDQIWPILDSHFERIEFEGDQMHVIKGALDVQFVQGIIAAFTKIHNPNDEDDFNITYEIVEVTE